MKTLLANLLILLTVSTPYLPNTFAQDSTQWELPENAIARIGRGQTRQIQYSPDGSLLAVASSIGIWIYDAETFQASTLLTGHTMPVLSVAFSPDGRTFASASADGTLQIWDRVTGTHKRRLIAHKVDVNSVAFSPDERILASGSDDGTVLLWDMIRFRSKAD